MFTESWVRYEPDGSARRAIFDVKKTETEYEPRGIVEVSYELWFDILGTLGFQPEVIPAEILSRLDQPIDETGIV